MQHVGTIIILLIIFWFIQNYQLLLWAMGVGALGAIAQIAVTNLSRQKTHESFDKTYNKRNKNTVSNIELENRKIPASPRTKNKSSLTLSNKAEIIRDVKRNGGLIIDKPWITMILSGQKTWEMRSRKSNKTGYIALIEKGTKQISGIARITGYSGKLTIQELKRCEKKHRVPASKYTADDYKWFIAIQLSNIAKLMHPIPYQHKSGAVTWVKLGEQAKVIEQLEKQIGGLLRQSAKQSKPKAQADKKVANIDQSKQWLKQLVDTMPIQSAAKGKYPVADDGAQFVSDSIFKDGLIHLMKGEQEYRFESYASALSALRRDKTIQWRCFRRNKTGWKKTASWSKEKN